MIRVAITVEVESFDHIGTLLALAASCAKSHSYDLELAASEKKPLKELHSRRPGPNKCPNSKFECLTQADVSIDKAVPPAGSPHRA